MFHHYRYKFFVRSKPTHQILRKHARRYLDTQLANIVSDYAPEGQAFLFLLAGKIECFVRPKGGL